MSSLMCSRIAVPLLIASVLCLLPLQAREEAGPRPAVAVSKIASSHDHTLAIAADGTVWAWGSNISGQLGDGSTIQRNAPVQMNGLTGIVAVAAGGSHSMALKSDGTLWACGSNGFGQLGESNTMSHREAPVQVSGMTGVVAVAAGSGHSLVLKSDGTVWAWGYNPYGQVGNGTTEVRVSMPVQVAGLTGIIAVAAGGYHSMALKSDGTVWTWGHNDSRQLGDGTATGRSVPVQVGGLTGVVAIFGGELHSFAIKGDGTLWGWGWNVQGQLGDNSVSSNGTPKRVGTLTGVVAAAGGTYHSLALKSDGTVWAWGGNSNGQLGDGSRTQRSVPQLISSLSGVAAIAAGSEHSLAVKSDRTLSAWGSNFYGQLGAGTPRLQTTPVQASRLTGVVGVAAGAHFSLAVRGDGTVWGWGNNSFAQSDGSEAPQVAAPAQAGGLTAVTAVAAGEYHSLALKNDGTVWAWGHGYDGQLGDGSAVWSRAAPVQVSGLTGVSAVAAGESHSLALKSDGTVWAWGRNSFGELGDGTVIQRNAPVRVSGLTGVTKVAAGRISSLALKNDGTVWVWGWKTTGIPSGTSSSAQVPEQVSGLSGITAIAVGSNHKLALRGDGTVWAWGMNLYGQLGDGTRVDKSDPVQVSGLSHVVAVAAGSHFCLALRSDGSVWAWGNNTAAQLGDGTAIQRLVPVQVGGFTWGAAVAGGGGTTDIAHSLALRRDGTVWGWGDDVYGQLGAERSAEELKPVAVVPFGSPDLTITKTHTGDFAVGRPAEYTLTVKNTGNTATTGAVTITDTLPPGLLNASGSGDDWTCSVTGQVVTCTNPVPIPPGATSTIILRVDLAAGASPGVTNIATVSNSSDLAAYNNTTGDPLYVTGVGCSYSVTPSSAVFAVAGGSAVFTTQTDSSCPWVVSGVPLWITVSSANPGTGSSAVTLAAAANTGAARSANIMIAGVSVALSQEAGVCSYSLSATGRSVSSSGGSGRVVITTGPACQWSVASPAAWLTFTSSASGSGTASVTFQAAPNTSGTARSARLSIAGFAYTVQQSASLPSNATFAGAIPQVASGSGWKTTFTIVNTGVSAATVRLNYWGNDGKELALPMSFPQSAASGLIQGPTLDRTIDAGATLIIESEAASTEPVIVGWAELFSTGPLAGLAVFRQRSGDGSEQEASVPLESRTAAAYLLPFDNIAGYASGIAAANHTASAMVLTVIQRDDAGRQVATVTWPLPAKGHDSFDLKSRWPALANRRGTIEVRGTAPGGMSILGLRFHPQGPFTTLPVTSK